MRKLYLFIILVFMIFSSGYLFGCAEDEENGSGTTIVDPPGVQVNKDPCKQEVRDQSKVSGRFWQSAATGEGLTYANSETEALAATSGIKDAEIKLITKGNPLKTTKTCEGGWFAFPDIPDNVSYAIINYGRKDCSTANCPINLATKAQANKPIKVLVFGDSIAVEADPKVTDATEQERYPKRLEKLLKQVATNITVESVAVSGSTTSDWLPSSGKDAAKITPADTYVFTLGGNDILAELKKFEALPPEEKAIKILNLAADIRNSVDQSISNIRIIVDNIRAQNQDADIILASYLNYTRSKRFEALVPEAHRDIAKGFLKKELEKVIKELSGYKGLMITDIYNVVEKSQNPDISSYTYDSIHLTPKGHQFLADQVFYTLGGWRADGSLGAKHYIGFP